MCANLLQAAQFPAYVPALISSALRKADRGLLRAVRNFAFLPNNFDSFSGSVHNVVLILSKRKLEARGQAEVFGKIAKGKFSVSGNIWFFLRYFICRLLFSGKTYLSVSTK